MRERRREKERERDRQTHRQRVRENKSIAGGATRYVLIL